MLNTSTYQVVNEGDDDEAETADVSREPDADATHLRWVLLGGEGVDDEEGGGLSELGHEVKDESGYRGACDGDGGGEREREEGYESEGVRERRVLG